jgi:membrane protease YdiL (CAAX protease family)
LTIFDGPASTRKGPGFGNLKNALLSLSRRAEFVIVVTTAFGYFVITSLLMAPQGATGPHHTDTTLIFLVVYETAILGLLLSFLGVRGWTRADIGLSLNPIEALIGFGLALCAYLLYVVAFEGFAMTAPQAARAATQVPPVHGGLSIITIVAVVIVNPIYEEAFVTGYIMKSLKDRGPWLGFNVSLAVRLAYHLYQGPIAVFSILPVGFVFGTYYARKGRLLPVIAAHAVLDLIGLAAFAR